MTGDHGNRFSLADSKDVPQFAPNFTVYVLPPDVVCLYSEDRKFFLHGELFCALASADRRRRKELSRARSRAGAGFSIRGQIHEALKRLIDRRYVVPASRCFRRRGGRLLGEPRPAAGDRREKSPESVACAFNRSTCRAQPSSSAALRGLGVRIVKRSADLTVTLVSDYLEERLGELNRQHLSDRTPWMLVAALRHFSPGGAGVQPGQERLLDLSCRSHETEPGGQGAPRPRAGPLRRRFAAGPAHARTEWHPACGRSRSRKRSPPTFARDLRDHIISLDLLGSTIVKHYVARRPQCPSCGRKKLRDPRRAPVPVELGAGGKLRHDQRRVPDRFAEGHGCTFPQAREPAHRRGLAPRTDRSRPAA